MEERQDMVDWPEEQEAWQEMEEWQDEEDWLEEED